MRKTMILMTVMALMVALVAGSATAKGKGSGQGNSGGSKGPALVTYTFKGTVEAVAEDGSSITVDVSSGNKAGRQHLGSQTFNVTPETKINLDEVEGATLDQIGEGYTVVVQSKADKDATSFDARVIAAESPEVEEAPVG